MGNSEDEVRLSVAKENYLIRLTYFFSKYSLSREKVRPEGRAWVSRGDIRGEARWNHTEQKSSGFGGQSRFRITLSEELPLLSEAVRYSSSATAIASQQRLPLTEPSGVPNDICIVARDKWDLAKKAHEKFQTGSLLSLQETTYFRKLVRLRAFTASSELNFRSLATHELFFRATRKRIVVACC